MLTDHLALEEVAPSIATIGWVDSYNHRGLHGSLGMVSPDEYEEAHYAALAREPLPA